MEYGAKLERAVPGTTFHLVSSGGRPLDSLRQALLGDPRVAVVEANHLGRVAAMPSDPYYAGSQASYLETVRLPEAWDLTTGADDLVLAVVDSGIRGDLPDLVGRVLPGRDIVSGDDDAEDTLGHGTRVATVAAARADNAGMSGVTWRGRVLPVKVVDATGYVSDANLAAGITWAADHEADVINLSVGGRPWSQAVEEAIQYARRRDAVVVAAAGNDGADSRSFPADVDGVVAVGAVDARGHLASFSSYGSWVDLVAPGVGILTGLPGGGYGLVDGTSFAAPMVAGIALLTRARFPNDGADRIVERLTAGARDIGPLGQDDYYGHGLVDALGAVGGPRPERPVDARHVREPDNMPGQASPMPISAPVRGTLAPEGDVDWFVVDVPTAQGWTIAVTAAGTGPRAALEASIDLYDSDLGGVRLRPDWGPGPATADVFLQAGRHYVCVRNRARSASSSYELSVSAAPLHAVVHQYPGALAGRLWIRDTTPAAGSSGAPPDVRPAFHFVENAHPYVENTQLQLREVSTGRVIPADRQVFPATRTVALQPREPLVAGRVYEFGGPPESSGWLPHGNCCFRFAVGSPLGPSSSAKSTGAGYWMVDSDGAVYPFGDATHHGRGPAAAITVDLEPSPTGSGYWTVDDHGAVTAHGDATWYGHADPAILAPGEQVTCLSATPTGRGYWLFTNKGRVVTHGDAKAFGDMITVPLNGPVLDSIPTPTGRGYYMVASDGGIFAFGDARFAGSMGGVRLNAPVQSLVPDPDGTGYWLVASDGGVFSFAAAFRGSMGTTPLNRPVTGMVAFGNGYLMVAEDGGIFNFSDRPFLGSAVATRPPHPIVAVAALPPPVLTPARLS